MSLVRDYQHYYCGTWIAQKMGDLNLPIYVESVEDTSDFDSDNFTEEHRASLQFHGLRYTLNPNGRVTGSRVQISVMDASLELESPDVGYVLLGRDIRWTVIRPVRQRLKGMAGNKIHGANLSNGAGSNAAKMVYDLFNPSFEGLVDRYTYVCPHTNKIHYKGAEIGVCDQTGRIFTVLTRFGYVRRRLANLYPDFTFQIVEAL